MAKLGTTTVYGSLTATSYITAPKVYNAVYNDLVDFMEISSLEEIKYGYVYYQTEDGLKLSYKKCQKGVVGIASDTFGFALGQKEKTNQVPIGISGWVLAKVDKEYSIGTPLTNNKYGELTKMTLWEKLRFPERLLAVMDRKEYKYKWNEEILVNGRNWVKIV